MLKVAEETRMQMETDEYQHLSYWDQPRSTTILEDQREPHNPGDRQKSLDNERAVSVVECNFEMTTYDLRVRSC